MFRSSPLILPLALILILTACGAGPDAGTPAISGPTEVAEINRRNLDETQVDPEPSASAVASPVPAVPGGGGVAPEPAPSPSATPVPMIVPSPAPETFATLGLSCPAGTYHRILRVYAAESVAEEGCFGLDDAGSVVKHGPWITFHENGIMASLRQWSKGIRSGNWRAWDRSGQPTLKGRYDPSGRLDGEVYASMAGVHQESQRYRAVFENGVLREAEILDYTLRPYIRGVFSKQIASRFVGRVELLERYSTRLPAPMRFEAVLNEDGTAETLVGDTDSLLLALPPQDLYGTYAANSGFVRGYLQYGPNSTWQLVGRDAQGAWVTVAVHRFDDSPRAPAVSFEEQARAIGSQIALVIRGSMPTGISSTANPVVYPESKLKEAFAGNEPRGLHGLFTHLSSKLSGAFSE